MANDAEDDDLRLYRLCKWQVDCPKHLQHRVARGPCRTGVPALLAQCGQRLLEDDDDLGEPRLLLLGEPAPRQLRRVLAHHSFARDTSKRPHADAGLAEAVGKANRQGF